MATPRDGRVERVEQLTPHMVRIVFGGDGLAGFSVGEWTDHYVKLMFPPPGAAYEVPFDVEQARALPRGERPTVRTFTVRHWDPEAAELTIDFVVHGDSGIAGPWARDARPGDLLQFLGPGGAYAPDPEADRHLMAGDECVVPAIAASLSRVPAGVPVHVFLEVDGPEDELPLESPGDLKLTWLHRQSASDAESPLLRAVERLDFPAGRLHGFVHGEAMSVRALRKHLLAERGVPRESLSVSGYWRQTYDEDRWQATKGDWNREVELDVA